MLGPLQVNKLIKNCAWTMDLLTGNYFCTLLTLFFSFSDQSSMLNNDMTYGTSREYMTLSNL